MEISVSFLLFTVTLIADPESEYTVRKVLFVAHSDKSK